MPHENTVGRLLEDIGVSYHAHRRDLMVSSDKGMTTTYNRFHNPQESADDIEHLRVLQAEMDQAVARTYSWDDLDLGHGFHQTKQGLRLTISEAARREVLDRLLRLNHERYAEEVAQGLHDKGGKRNGKSNGGGKPRARRASTVSASTLPLFGGE